MGGIMSASERCPLPILIIETCTVFPSCGSSSNEHRIPCHTRNSRQYIYGFAEHDDTKGLANIICPLSSREFQKH